MRDETHEIQRKAHAKRVRETRRSTQGITLEDLKSAEQLAKKKQQQQAVQKSNQQSMSGSSPNIVTSTATSSTESKAPTINSADGVSSIQILDIDQKEDFEKLWKEAQTENESLKRDRKLIRSDLESTKKQRDAVLNTSKPETEVCDKILQKNLLEMEEQAKIIEQLKVDNLRLRDENGALIRVIAKLSK